MLNAFYITVVHQMTLQKRGGLGGVGGREMQEGRDMGIYVYV